MTLKSLQLMQQFKHDPRYDFRKVRVFYVDRGAPNDESAVDGAMIIESDSKFGFKVFAPIGDSKFIPYHRITHIEYDGKCMFSR